MTHAPQLSRRDWLRLSTAGVVGFSQSGWLERLAADTAAHPQRKKSCILLWMAGGPSQLETFDLKQGHANAGPFKAIATAAEGVQISEHFPRIARFTDRMAIVRSLTSKEGDHVRASYLLRTGYLPQGPIQYPSIGALVSKELGDEKSELPNFVSLAPNFLFAGRNAYGPGFLGPQYAPLVVAEQRLYPATTAEQALKVEDLAPPQIGAEQVRARIDLLHDLERDFLARHPDTPPQSHQAAYDRAVRLMRSAAATAFELEKETSSVRDAYGRNLFGQGCLLARRLVERGVPFIEVTLDGWDTHAQNAATVKRLSETFDPAWAALMQDLKERGLLDSTLIVWMGEFGRTPKFGRADGRDHWPTSFSAVLAGGGVKGGQVIGSTSEDGMSIKDRPVTVPQFLATICQALGIDHEKQNISNVGRPIRIVEPGTKPVQEALS